jgi:PAS domain S-box-containing protein
MPEFTGGLFKRISSWLNSPNSKQKSASSRRFPQIRTSLSFIVVSVMVFLALIPVALIIAGSYIRTRDFIQEQAIRQLESLVQSQSPQLALIPLENQDYLTGLLSQAQITNYLFKLADTSGDQTNLNISQAYLQNYIQQVQPSIEANIDAVFLVGTDFHVKAASKPEWFGLDLTGESAIQQVAGVSKTVSAYSPSSLYINQWVTFTSHPLIDENGVGKGTLVIATFPGTPKTILETTGSLFDQGNAFFINSDNSLVGISPKTKQIIQLPTSSIHSERLREILSSPSGQGSGRFDNPDLIPVFAYAKWIPEMNIGYVVEVPESVVFRQIDTLIPSTVVILCISLLFIGIMVFLGSRAVVNPIVKLTKSALNFANGDWSERSDIHRGDEIGVLAKTFNQMVDQISDLYRSLEQKVEERARQLRTASEIGQLATSSNNRDEIIDRAVKLVIDRFGYAFASIFLLDQSGTSAVLSAAYSQSGEFTNQKGYRVQVNSDSLIGWVANNNQPRVISEYNPNEFPPSTLFLSATRSEVAIPIALGNHVLGVFEVQSVNSKGFEPESIAVLQTIGNQIANGLQNLRLLEATQVNLDEINLLFRTSRQLSFTKNEQEMYAVVQEALAQTPYISGIFSAADNYLEIIAITDPQNPSTTSTTKGITLPLLKVSSALGGNQMVLIDDLSRPNEFDVILSFFVRRGCNSAAIFTITYEDRLENIIVLGSREITPLAATALRPFSSLVDVIGTTLQRFRILSSLQERVTLLQALNRVSEAISAVTDLETLYKTLHNQMKISAGEDISFLIALYDEAQGMIEIPYVYEGDELLSIPPFPLGEGLTSYIIQNRTSLMIVKDTEQRIRELKAKVIGKPARSWLGVPLLLGNKAIGALILQDTENEERFTDHDLNLFSALAPQIAVTVSNVQLLSDMQKALRAYDQERFLLNTLMENTPDQVFFKDTDGRYLRASQSFTHLNELGEPETVIGKKDEDLFNPERASVLTSSGQEVMDSGQPVLGNIEKIKIGNDDTWRLTSLIPMTDASGNQRGLLGIDRDITTLKQTEEIAQTRANQLQIAAEIARDTSGTLDTGELLKKAVNLIRERFGFYHASIFLMDPLGEFAVLRESTGAVGEQMKQRGHRLSVGSQSIVGQVTSKKSAWIVNDVHQEPLYYANPLLPETNAELAIPLVVGEKLLGAIDVQSTLINIFQEEDVQILQILADQLAIAVWNSILFGQSQDNLAQHRLLHQITIAASTANSVDEALGITVQALYTATGGERVLVMLLNRDTLQVRTAVGYEGVDLSQYSLRIGEGIPGQAAELRQPVRINDMPDHPEYTPVDQTIRSELAVPIFFRDRMVGVLDLSSTESGAYDETDQEIMASLGNTLGAIIANTQLIQEVRQQVDRQQRLYDITSRIRRTSNIETILQTSAREIALTLGAKRAQIEIKVENPAGVDPIANNGHKGLPEVEK